MTTSCGTGSRIVGALSASATVVKANKPSTVSQAREGHIQIAATICVSIPN